MGFIEDGGGSGNLTHVSDGNRLKTEALAISLQHYISHSKKSAYQVSNTINIAASKQPIMLVQNGSIDKDISVTYIRIHSAGAASTNENAYFTLEAGGQWASGGSDLTPTNMNIASSNAAVGTFKGGTGIVTTGTFIEIDRNYTANTMQIYNKEAALVIPRGQSLAIYHTGSTAAGIAYCRVSFVVSSLI